MHITFHVCSIITIKSSFLSLIIRLLDRIMCKLWLILIIANSLLIISAYSRVSSSYSSSTSVTTLPHPLHKTALHATQLTAEASASNNLKTSKVSLWPCGDDLDKKIMNLAIPALLNFAIVPLVGAADCFWVGRMRNALALSGQGAANQVFNSAFWFLSFLPSVVSLNILYNSSSIVCNI